MPSRIYPRTFCWDGRFIFSFNTDRGRRFWKYLVITPFVVLPQAKKSAVSRSQNFLSNICNILYTHTFYIHTHRNHKRLLKKIYKVGFQALIQLKQLEPMRNPLWMGRSSTICVLSASLRFFHQMLLILAGGAGAVSWGFLLSSLFWAFVSHKRGTDN